MYRVKLGAIGFCELQELHYIRLINVDRTIFVLVFFDSRLDMASEEIRETLSLLFEDVLDFLFLSVGYIEVHRTREFFALCHTVCE